ncbi:hypothetical protein [Streptomyces buecherae]|uniref:Uncharacterized protein n=1 Tax=Streptomyces buecherae TaxID=2763006 RepID=A0A7H8N3L3_9ACTN|nr:hypothetical protein [Streptomyces buecherae]QKW48931.1 hypothetical protein HUT08_04550 [Streptomyces buecherae]
MSILVTQEAGAVGSPFAGSPFVRSPLGPRGRGSALAVTVLDSRSPASGRANLLDAGSDRSEDAAGLRASAPRYALDETEIRTELGLAPRHSGADGLAATVDGHRPHRSRRWRETRAHLEAVR